MAEASCRLRAGQYPGLRHGWLAGLVLLLLGLSFLGTAAGATTITDDRGHRVSLDGVPARIVSVYPSLTEMVCQLGH